MCCDSVLVVFMVVGLWLVGVVVVVNVVCVGMESQTVFLVVVEPLTSLVVVAWKLRLK